MSIFLSVYKFICVCVVVSNHFRDNQNNSVEIIQFPIKNRGKWIQKVDLFCMTGWSEKDGGEKRGLKLRVDLSKYIKKPDTLAMLNDLELQQMLIS